MNHVLYIDLMDFSINNKERLDLKRMIGEMESENNTENIRKVKHSVLIRDDIRKLETLKLKQKDLYENDQAGFIELCQTECAFLITNYHDIFNKIVKNELDLEIMTKFLMVLKMIEDGKLDQHEGSVAIGKLLKELYLDSAVRHADNLDKQYSDESTIANAGANVTWKEFKAMRN